MVKFNRLIPELYVTNIAASLNFYQIIGFNIVYERAAEKFAFLNCEGAQLMLEEFDTTSWLTGEMELPFGRGVNFQIEVSDVKAIYQICQTNNFKIFKDMWEKTYVVKNNTSHLLQFILQDPDGYLLRFNQVMHG